MGSLARRRAHPSVVDENQLAPLGEEIEELRIPVVHRAAIPLKKHERRRRPSAEAPVRVACAADVDILRVGLVAAD